jgi:zinc D-Ala-D-Ala dipeptidase
MLTLAINTRGLLLAPAYFLVVLLVTTLVTADSAMAEHPADLPEAASAAGLVNVTARIPGLVLDIRYATVDNFVGEAVYPVPRCWLQADVTERLGAVQNDLAQQGFGLKIFDCYRPFSVQEHLWGLMPDERYVGKPVRDSHGNPVEGSRHNRGAAVDVSLVDLASGNELAMPTDYDDFSERAAADNSDLDTVVIANRQILIQAMAARGFTVLASEWWHFDADGWEQYPLLDVGLR